MTRFEIDKALWKYPIEQREAIRQRPEFQFDVLSVIALRRQLNTYATIVRRDLYDELIRRLNEESVAT